MIIIIATASCTIPEELVSFGLGKVPQTKFYFTGMQGEINEWYQSMSKIHPTAKFDFYSPKIIDTSKQPI